MSAERLGFDVIPGDLSSPVILHVPHSSRKIPRDVRERIVLGDEELRIELARMTDAGTGELASGVADVRLAPWRFVNRLSRLVIDPERFPDEREAMESVGMGAVYARTSHGAALRDDDAAHRESLLADYFRPYASALAELVDLRVAATGRAVIIDLHSFPRQRLPYELHPAARRPQVCLGTDSFHTPGWLLKAAKRAFARFDTAMDEPFAGTYVPLRHYGTDTRVSSIMVELRRDVLAHPDGFSGLAAALRTLIGEAGD